MPDGYRNLCNCGTRRRVLKPMQCFMRERDRNLKTVYDVVLLEDLICDGGATFGPFDRCCFLFWMEEWLEKVPVEQIPVGTN